MIRLTSSDIFISIFNITERITKFELYKVPDEKSGGVSYEKVRDEIEKLLEVTDITAIDLQDETIGPNILEEYRKYVTKGMKNDECMRILTMYKISIFQDFESFLRTEVDLLHHDVKLVSDEYISSFITYEITSGFKSYKDILRLF